MTLLLLAQNEIKYDEPTHDPFFAAHRRARESFEPDSPVSVMGCIDQTQLCNPSKKLCTALAGVRQVNQSLSALELNQLQKGVADRIITAASKAVMYREPLYRGNNALLADQTVFRRNSVKMQTPLPSDQWINEMKALFESGLAGMQQRILGYATGPSNTRGQYKHNPDDPVGKKMCSIQKFRSTEPSTSFSVLGMMIILIWVIVIIPFSYVLDFYVGSALHRPLKRAHLRHRQWILNSYLQLHRFTMDGANVGTWSRKMRSIPVTELGEQLVDLDSIGWAKMLLPSSTSKMALAEDDENQRTTSAEDVNGTVASL